MIRLIASAFYRIPIKTRMPFRYGIATLTETPHLFCELTVDVDGKISHGLAADNLIPKWFTKDPSQSYQEEIDAMLEVIGMAARHAQEVGSAADVFTLWEGTYRAQQQWAQQTPHPPLLWNFGVSLIERALIDAYCRAMETPFADAVAGNLLGIELGRIHPELAGLTPAQFLPKSPSPSILVRHTIGLADTLSEAELTPAERLQDNLPQTLEASIQAYGLRYFKIKISGDEEQDLHRIERITAIIQANTPRYAFTLDGNEQYVRVEDFRQFWERLAGTAVLQPFKQHLLFVEQPFHRRIALAEDTKRQLLAWKQRPRMIIDESDAELHSLLRALDCGYAGTSHKNCKGVFKGLANACFLAQLRQAEPGQDYILSGEDLANVGPVALLQDLAVMATLGLSHVERNGHHYFPGLSMFPRSWQQATLAAHPDLYVDNGQGTPVLSIVGGRLSLQSILQAPFGVAANIDLREATPVVLPMRPMPPGISTM